MGRVRTLVRECPCGEPYMILQAGELGEILADDLRRRGVQVFLTGKRTARCRCGAEIALPPSEVLDMDRTPFGRWLAEHVDKGQ